MQFQIGDRVRLLVRKDYGDRAFEPGTLGTVLGLREIIGAYQVMFDGDAQGRLVPDGDVGPADVVAAAVAVRGLTGEMRFRVGEPVRLRVRKDFGAGRVIEGGRRGDVTALRPIIEACGVRFDGEPTDVLVPQDDLEPDGGGGGGGARATKAKALVKAKDVGPVQQALKIMLVHGVGDHHTTDAWQGDWERTVRAAIGQWNPAAVLDFSFPIYDGIFEKYKVDPEVIAGAVWKLVGSGVSSEIDGLLGRFNVFGGSRGLGDVPTELRWTAGMVAQWADSAALREEAREYIKAQVAAYQPDVIAAHSLGSLICYDLFSESPDLLTGRTLITFGSQIGNPFVVGTFGGRVAPLADAAFWYHLFNENDRAFAHEIRLMGPGSERFAQELTPFRDGFLSHDAVQYLGHPQAVASAWRAVSGAPQSEAVTRALTAVHVAARRPDRRALLVGINEYPKPEMRLDGCVNDVYLISAALQESGFSPDEIRVVLDDRATAAGITDRLHWLLDDVADGDQRVLFYSGHGAQIPEYGAYQEIDHVDECLVPWDFDWSPQRAITDKQFLRFYSQLPYGSDFVAIFDCCHSGGMTRDGAAKVRGVSPPDDIRHRALRWDAGLERWVPREFDPAGLPPGGRSLAQAASALRSPADRKLAVFRATNRLGQGISLRRLDRAQYEAAKESHGEHKGPYMPILFEACQEGELSYEYRHGATSYGAFTYSLTEVLRAHRRKGENVTFKQLADEAAEQLRVLGYQQTPCFQGPKDKTKLQVPWSGGDRAAVQKEVTRRPKRRGGKGKR